MRLPNPTLSGVIGILLGGGLGYWVAHPAADGVYLTFIDVGQGDATLLRVNDRAILVDTGPESGDIVRELTHERVFTLDRVFLTHLDMDHIGGTVAIRRRFPQARIAMGAGFRNHPDLPRYLRQWRLNAEDIDWIPVNANLSMNPVQIRIFSPVYGPSVPDNDGSLCMRITGGRGSAVLTGDLSEAGERELAQTGDWRAQVMKCGHHGSARSTSLIWLTEVQPQVAVVSCGRYNRYGHPAAATLARLRGLGIRTVRTDEAGTVRFTLGDGGFRLAE